MASGVMAAKQKRSVIIIEPSRWLGGMMGGGLSHVDWGREKAVGGTALSILSKILIVCPLNLWINGVENSSQIFSPSDIVRGSW